jgi:hypothetical protein
VLAGLLLNCCCVAGPKYARLRSSKLASWYIFLSVYLMVLFCLYPIVWGLAEGSNTIAIVAEVGCDSPPVIGVEGPVGYDQCHCDSGNGWGRCRDVKGTCVCKGRVSTGGHEGQQCMCVSNRDGWVSLTVTTPLELGGKVLQQRHAPFLPQRWSHDSCQCCLPTFAPPFRMMCPDQLC